MSLRFRRFPFVLSLVMMQIRVSGVHAAGRQPDDRDQFPDYNRVELHPAKTVASSDPEASETARKPDISKRSSLPTVAPSPFPPEDLDHPRPPPAPQMSGDESEPALPEEVVISTGVAPPQK